MPAVTHIANQERVQTATRRDTLLSTLCATEPFTVVTVFLVSIAYLCLFCRYSSIEPDEGIVLQGAERILHGEVPYRDFFSFYTPGAYYIVAAFSKLFGYSLTVARASLAIGGGCSAAIVYVVSRRVCSRPMALFAAALTTIDAFPYRFLVLHNWYSTFLCCFALYAAVRLFESKTTFWAFAMGSLASLTVLVEQSKGAGLGFGIALGFVLMISLDREQLRASHPLFAVVGVVWPFLITFAYFAYEHALGVMIRDWFWPLEHYAAANHVPYAYQNWSPQDRQALFHSGGLALRIVKIITISPGLIVPFVPLIAIALLVSFAAKARRHQQDSCDRTKYYLLLCATMTGLWISVVIGRADVIHFMYLAPFWYMVLAWVLGAEDPHSPVLRSTRQLLAAYIVVAFGMIGFALLLNVTGANARIATRRGAISTHAADTVIPYVQGHLAPGSQLLVYPYLPLYNYLTATQSPAPLDYYQPGMNTVEQAEAIARSLESSGAPVLLEPAFREKVATAWPGTRPESIKRDAIEDYILKNYNVCATLQSPTGWRFEYRVRKGLFCP